MDQGSRKAIKAAFAANLGVAAGKFVGFLVTGASSLLAEALHSLADTTNQGLLMLGARQARRRPTTQHPFGYGRQRYFWSFVVALVLFSAGGLFAIHEGTEKLRHPHPLEQPLWGVGILVLTLGLESFSLRTAAREANRVRRGRSWWTFIRQSKNPEITVVLLEDTGALVGITFALTGIGLSMSSGDPRFDAMGSLAIGVLLVVIAAVLMIEMWGLLIGEAADPEVEAVVRLALVADPAVVRVLNLRTEHLAPDQLLVAAEIELAPDLGGREVARIIDDAEARIRDVAPIARHIYLEPDLQPPEGGREPPPRP